MYGEKSTKVVCGKISLRAVGDEKLTGVGVR